MKHNEISTKRFEREVRHTSTLTHPNTVAIYDYGRTPEGNFYYAMEYLPGVDLDELIQADGPMHQGRAVHVLRQACGALAEAHEKGLVHRDIKPSNLMLTHRGGLFDFLKVLDFGLVRNVDQSATMNLTSDDVLVGTPLYMAPEAFKDPTDLTAKADVYSLGAVAYYMLAGEHAFMAPGLTEVIGKHLSGSYPPLEERRGEAIDGDLHALIVRCLEKKPEARPSASELEDALEALRNVPSWSRADARAWWEANASQRDKDGSWIVDFAASAPTPSKEPISAAFHVDFDKRGQSDASSGQRSPD